MSGPFKIEITFRKSVYTLGIETARELLAGLERAEGLPPPAAAALRDDLRSAIARHDAGPDTAPAVVPPNPVGEDTAAEIARRMPVLKNVAAENSAACGDCRIPRCRFCDRPGVRAGGRKDAAGRMIERYYICKTPNCLASRLGTPQPLELFAGCN